jgi:hypothetical protein
MDNAGDIALKAVGNGVVLAVKAVPGAKRSRIVGVLGDCLKIATSGGERQSQRRHRPPAG